ncbi:DUF4147 domain-containing protein [Gemmatimonadota bacterium DH-20]|uniref:DUF4147 domain-containing protein n=1 Tax=Gaopeijia maritima TaxID=3119007 RepID=A0ABU9ECK3_9BACT
MDGGWPVRADRGLHPAPGHSGLLTPQEILAALVRASARGADPARRVAAALADDPELQQWAAAVADGRRGRLALLGLGGWADAMVRGALALFGPAVDEAIVALPERTGGLSPSPAVPREGLFRFEADPLGAGRMLEGWSRTLTAADRVLVMLSPGDDHSAVLPLEPADVHSIAHLLEGSAGARLSTESRLGVRARLDRLRGGGLSALLGPATVVGIDWKGLAAEFGPLGEPGPSGRTVEIDLRRAGVPIPERVMRALRAEADAHPAERASPSGGRHLRLLDRGAESLDATLAEARALGLSATVLTDALTGDAVAAGRGMARVATAIADGLGGLRLPAVALASGRLDGGEDRHRRLMDSARAHLGEQSGLVQAWSPLRDAPDLVAVVVPEPN